MSDVYLNVNLDYEPNQNDMFIIVKNADDLFSNLEANGIMIDGAEISVNSPKQYTVLEREQDNSLWEEDDEDFIAPETRFDEDGEEFILTGSCLDDELEDYPSHCFCDDDADENYLSANPNYWRQ